jgi:hypothetical protein
MGKKDNSNILDKFTSFGKMNERWDEMFDFTIKYFIHNKYSDFVIRIISSIRENKIVFWTLFALASWYWSQLLLSLFYFLMLIDSMILSLLVIQNNSVNANARRLSKNVILIAMTSLNLIGGILSLFAIVFIYMEWSKSINIIVFKTIKFILKTISNFFPGVYLMYPGIKLFSFNESDMTIRENSESSSETSSKKNKKKNNKNSVYKYIDLDLKNKHKSSDSSDSSDSDSYESDSSDSDGSDPYSSESKLILNSKSYFPTISSIKKNNIGSKRLKNNKNTSNIKNIKNIKNTKNTKNIKNKKNTKKNVQENSEPIGSQEVMILTKFGLDK